METEFSLEELAFFEGFPPEFAVYRKLKEAIFRELPQSSCRVQKTQISFDNRRLYACVSLPLRRKRGWPEHFLMLTLGLPNKKDSPRVAVATEPYPNRWTHHILLEREEQIDSELLCWLRGAYEFSLSKR